MKHDHGPLMRFEDRFLTQDLEAQQISVVQCLLHK